MRRAGKDFSGAKIALKARPAGGAAAPTDDAGFARGASRLLTGLLIAALALIAPASPAAARNRGAYTPKGNCDGFPRITVTTPPRLCLGLVATGLGFPRGLALIGTDLYIADLSSRTPGRGRILRLANYGRGAPEVVLSGLNQPSGIAARNGALYVGEVGRIIRFNPRAADPKATVAVVMTGLPDDGRHNLTALALAPDGGIIVNVGSYSDNCETDAGGKPNPAAKCPEQLRSPPRGSLLRIGPEARIPVSAGSAEVFATGIRNAMGLAFLPNGALLAASNARDNIDSADPKLSDDQLPHDTLMLVEKGANYGWPYCFDMGRPAPEFPRFNCASVRAPAMLLAPHAAPLSMLRYTGTKLPGLTGKLILGYHGYRARGHRIVAIALGADGRPTGGEIDLVSGWTTVPGLRPMGQPSAMLQLPDGSVLIVEDQNRTLLRLSTTG